MTSRNNQTNNQQRSYADDSWHPDERNTNYYSQGQLGANTKIETPEDHNFEDQKREEEFAAETAVTPDEFNDRTQMAERETHMEETAEAGWGWAAIILSLLAFFMWPLVMGIAGIVVGVMAKRRGADTLGNIAIVAGIAAIVINLFLAPLF
ncbi:hypothetical protein SAMN05421676_106138 [Salinibacillus kushneri]|uniref:DUF4190 domain-containing protein n=1 Tax=Salinibacillus kushneri TaxID=237682 RepID=A0A1I0FZQ4_9BACI|nr:DUF4190 domain-containing protein [Salinibacillus kushneri]SET63197.1 hypothetical protein SAMN05421676_106138 [Salinibacillus kushneri]